MIPWLSLLTASAWVDFVVIILSKVIGFSKPLNLWYDKFDIVASTLDILSVVIGVSLAKFIVPTATGVTLAGVSIGVQVVHDVLFGVIITSIPAGHNQLIDVFKSYTKPPGNWRILVGDAGIMASTVFLMEWLEKNLSKNLIAFAGVLAIYALLYILYTK